MTNDTRIIVFDVGGVLIDWNPEYLYRKLLPDNDVRAHFLHEICPFEWNAGLDRGLKTWEEAIADRIALYPEHAELIRAYDERWPEMVAGPIEDTVSIKQALHTQGVPLYAITNYSSEKWDLSCTLWPFLAEFDGVVVSGKEKLMKPDPAIYRLLCDRYALNPADCLFIDDRADNIQAARNMGMQGVVFTDATSLAHTLENDYGFRLTA